MVERHAIDEFAKCRGPNRQTLPAHHVRSTRPSSEQQVPPSEGLCALSNSVPQHSRRRPLARPAGSLPSHNKPSTRTAPNHAAEQAERQERQRGWQRHDDQDRAPRHRDGLRCARCAACTILGAAQIPGRRQGSSPIISRAHLALAFGLVHAGLGRLSRQQSPCAPWRRVPSGGVDSAAATPQRLKTTPSALLNPCWALQHAAPGPNMQLSVQLGNLSPMHIFAWHATAWPLMLGCN